MCLYACLIVIWLIFKSVETWAQTMELYIFRTIFSLGSESWLGRCLYNVIFRSSEPTGTGASFRPGTWQPPTWLLADINVLHQHWSSHWSVLLACLELVFRKPDSTHRRYLTTLNEDYGVANVRQFNILYLRQLNRVFPRTRQHYAKIFDGENIIFMVISKFCGICVLLEEEVIVFWVVRYWCLLSSTFGKQPVNFEVLFPVIKCKCQLAESFVC